jgi:hypothetical protein
MKISKAVLVALCGLFLFASVGQAQFAKSVVVLKGSIKDEATGTPRSIKVSVRSAEDPAQEVTSSVSNSETGNYLVVLKPATKYIVRLQQDGQKLRDTIIETPNKNIQLAQDFSIGQTGGTMAENRSEHGFMDNVGLFAFFAIGLVLLFGAWKMYEKNRKFGTNA